MTVSNSFFFICFVSLSLIDVVFVIPIPARATVITHGSRTHSTTVLLSKLCTRSIRNAMATTIDRHRMTWLALNPFRISCEWTSELFLKFYFELQISLCELNSKLIKHIQWKRNKTSHLTTKSVLRTTVKNNNCCFDKLMKNKTHTNKANYNNGIHWKWWESWWSKKFIMWLSNHMKWGLHR